jgi:hypothetical protein
VTGSEKQRDEATSWIEPLRPPTEAEKKVILAAVISHTVKTVMTNHVYTTGGVIYRQSGGGSIGLRATGEISRLVCLRFDKVLRERTRKAGITQIMYGRYVDDSNSAYLAVDPGSRMEGGVIVVKPEMIEADLLIPPDERTLSLIQGIANGIFGNLQWTFDVPSKYPNKRMPVLDLQVGIKDRRISFQFYEKSVSTRYTIPARSAHSWEVKRSTLTQEGVRRLLNTSPDNSVELRRQILENWDQKMRVSGYNTRFRRKVVKAAIGIYRDKVVKAMRGEVPLYRDRKWQKNRRDKEKLMKMSNWFKTKGPIETFAPLIMNPTDDGMMRKEIDSILEQFKTTHGMAVKIMERGGRKCSADIKSDPFGNKVCSRPNCMICTHDGTKGGCRGQGMAYTQTCKECPSGEGMEKESAVYYGETGRSNYERGVSHLRDLRNEVLDTPLWKHCQLVHDGMKVEFQMETVGTFPSCEERQTNEGSRVKLSVVKHVLNSKSEWHQPPLYRVVIDTGNEQQEQGDTWTQGGAGSRGRGRGQARGRARGAAAGRRGRRAAVAVTPI